MAAPAAIGRPHPIDAPVICNQSWGGALARPLKNPRPKLTLSSTTMALSGNNAASVCVTASGVIDAAPHRFRSLQVGYRDRRRPHRLRQARQRVGDVLLRARDRMDRAVLGKEVTGFVGIGERRDRWLRSHKQQVLGAGEHRDRLIDAVGQSHDRVAALPMLNACIELRTDDLRAGCRGDAVKIVEHGGADRMPAQEDGDRLATKQERRGVADDVRSNPPQRGRRERLPDDAAIVPAWYRPARSTSRSGHSRFAPPGLPRRRRRRWSIPSPQRGSKPKRRAPILRCPRSRADQAAGGSSPGRRRC